MRDMIFKAKLKSNGNWVEGYYTEIPVPSLGATIFDGSGESIICEETESCIISITTGQHPNYSSAIPFEVVECEKYVVDPETVGQYTGLKDKNGNRIFEGDVLKTDNSNCETWTVDYKPSAFCANQSNANYSCMLDDFMIETEVEVVGNIHNKEDLNSVSLNTR